MSTSKIDRCIAALPGDIGPLGSNMSAGAWVLVLADVLGTGSQFAGTSASADHAVMQYTLLPFRCGLARARG